MKNKYVILFIVVLTALGWTGAVKADSITINVALPQDIRTFPTLDTDSEILFYYDLGVGRGNSPQFVIGTAENGTLIYSKAYSLLSTIEQDPDDLGVSGGQLFMETSEIDHSNLSVFNLQGKMISEFALQDKGILGTGIGVSSGRGEIYHGEASDAGLVSVYNLAGAFKRVFGTPILVSEPSFLAVANETRMGVDSAGDIVVAFTRFPLIRKYSRKGNLLWEQDLSTQSPLIAQYIQCEQAQFPIKIDGNAYRSFVHTQGLGFGNDNDIYLLYGHTLLIVLSSDGQLRSTTLLLASQEGSRGSALLTSEFTNLQIKDGKVFVPFLENVLVYSLNNTQRASVDLAADIWCSETPIPYAKCKVECANGKCSGKGKDCTCTCSDSGSPVCKCSGSSFPTIKISLPSPF